MFRTILLLSPIYITLFWSIALKGNNKKHNFPQALLSKFMLFPAVCFIALFLYFVPFPELYSYFDCFLQYAICFLFPVYYLFFRLLTIDDEFSLKKHIRYLIIPFIVATCYCVGIFFTPWIEYKTWLFNENAFSDSPYILYLSVIRNIIRILFLVQFIVFVIGNQLLIQKYGVKAEQFYSDMEEENYKNAKMLNFLIVIMFITSFIAYTFSYRDIIPKELALKIILSISSIILFLIGFLGIKQEPINPTFEFVSNDDALTQLEVIPLDSRKKILHKIQLQFEEEKIYLNSQLNIMDIVQAVGTNRTYISSIINQHYNQNFCSFVNSYRIKELESVIYQNPYFTNEVLAESCGFGSLNSLKRAIFTKSGMTLSEWKKQIAVAK
jgi:AraC-like DNA-binding protein